MSATEAATFKTTEGEHPLLGEVIRSVEQGEGELCFRAGALDELEPRILAIDHPAEAWMLAEDLIGFAFYLDKHKGAKAASSELLKLTTKLAPTLEQAISIIRDGEYSEERAKAFAGALGENALRKEAPRPPAEGEVRASPGARFQLGAEFDKKS